MFFEKSTNIPNLTFVISESGFYLGEIHWNRLNGQFVYEPSQCGLNEDALSCILNYIRSLTSQKKNHSRFEELTK